MSSHEVSFSIPQKIVLAKDVEFGTCWFGCAFFHPLPCGRVNPSSQHFFCSNPWDSCVIISNLYGMATALLPT